MNLHLRRLFKVLLWIVGIWATLLIFTEIFLSSRFVTRTVNKYASEYVDGSIEFGNISFSMLRKFPYANLTLEEFSVTYPSDRYDALEAKSPQGHLLYRGCGQDADTLASFQRFSVSLNPYKLIFGNIHIPEVELVSPRIFAHSYDEQNANWNITRTQPAQESSESEEDSSSSGLPHISIGKIRMTSHPHIVYTDSKDTLFAMIDIKRAGFNGKLNTRKFSTNRIGMHIDSLLVAGRTATDTIAVALEKLYIHEQNRQADFQMKANALAATYAFGRVRIPVDINGAVQFPRDSVPAIRISKLDAEIASIPFGGEAYIRLMQDRASIDGRLSINGCNISDILKGFVNNIVPETKKISTDAVIYAEAECSSEYVYGAGKLPECTLTIKVPDSHISYSDLPAEVKLNLNTTASVDRNGKINISIIESSATATGLDLTLKGSAKDLMGTDPQFEIDGQMSACLEKLIKVLPDTTDIEAVGTVKARLKGKARMSDLSLYTFSQAELNGALSTDTLKFISPADSIYLTIDGTELTLGPENLKSRRDTTRSFRLIALNGRISNADISMKEALNVSAKGLNFSVKSDSDIQSADKVKRASGRIGAGSLIIRDASGTSINLDQTQNGITLRPSRKNPNVPVISVSSSNKRITLATDVNRAILTDASFKANATMNTVERRLKMKSFMDSLARVYPDVPKDSLMIHLMAQRSKRELPDWLKEEDFRKSDINITLDETVKKYFRDWDLNGDIDIRTGILMTPYFPARNILRGCEISFTNDKIAIDSLKIASGGSEIAFKGALTGLRRSILGRGTIKLNADILSDKMDANELLAAFKSGSAFNPETATSDMANASNSEFFKMVTVDTLTQEAPTPLIVIPSNLTAGINVHAKDIIYSNLSVSELNATMCMKERCIQITNTMATSNMGDVSFEGFYATRAKTDIRAGFNFNFKDITAEKAIELMPAVDTIMPLLKSFGGNLNCELAATARLDTNMNIITPSINGVLRIGGNNLSISDSDLFTSLAKKLKFNNKKIGRIPQMTVEGVIKDNILEVFPFVLSMDRYTLALSGKQNLDKSFKYHASIIRSPLIIKVGVDLHGPDFDHMKFRIGKPKYKNENVPVFSTMIDQTKINLAESIRNIFEKGVEAAVQENEKQDVIDAHRKETGYINAVDQETEELSEEEQKQLEENTENIETTENEIQ